MNTLQAMSVALLSFIIMIIPSHADTPQTAPHQLLRGDIIDMAIVMSGFRDEKIDQTSQCLSLDQSLFRQILERASKICRGNDQEVVSGEQVALVTEQFGDCLKAQLTAAFTIEVDTLLACIPEEKPQISLAGDDEFFDDIE